MSTKKVELYSTKYFGLCSLGGVLSCGLTHGLMTPVDCVKCMMQTGAKFNGPLDGIRTLAKTNPIGLTYGWMPTFIGYGFQGMAKFGLYEFFKHKYTGFVGKEKVHGSKTLETLLFMGASASAEFFADILLCPWEAVKVKIQTSEKGTFPTSMTKGMATMYKTGGLGVFFRGLVPLWTRQIPYTIIKFTTFERIVGILFKHVFNAKPRYMYSKAQQLGVTFLSGYLAGIFCAIVSHPADVVVSKLNKNPGTPVGEIVSKLGFKGMWSGLGTRIFMIGTLTALQWYIYDSFKTFNNFPTSGGH